MTFVTRAAHGSVALMLAPIMAVIAAAFLVVGIALPVLPLHVHDRLGFGTVMVGVVAGMQFAASLISRVWSGIHVDRHGPRSAVIVGLLAGTAAGALYLASLWFVRWPVVSVTILLAGRAALGAAESFIITGGVGWGLRLGNQQSAGRVIAWVGMAMFSAMALGGPIGTFLFAAYGFAAIAIASLIVPLAVLGLVGRMPAPDTLGSTRAPARLQDILGSVWLPGLGAAFACVGYGAILAFGALLFVERGWTPVWLAFTSFGLALIAARFVLGNLPDRAGGARVALVFVIVEAFGLCLIWYANGPICAAVGAGLAGLGYSLVYPGLGVEAVNSVRPENRGVAMGAYTVCLDLALGVSGPPLGTVGAAYGTASIFLVSALSAVGSGLIAWRILAASR